MDIAHDNPTQEPGSLSRHTVDTHSHTHTEGGCYSGSAVQYSGHRVANCYRLRHISSGVGKCSSNWLAVDAP